MPKLESLADAKYQLQLPTVSFRVIDDDKSLLVPAGVHSEQIRHFGYNDFSEFERPEHYIRHIEPIESELATQVEYDMDEQDKEWLDVVNAERKKEQSGPVSYEIFEIIMDKLEKEWFNLIKRIPQPASHMPVEDSRCAICDDGEGENSNAIVFCDGCNLAVHQDCYGVPYIPEGQWLCRKCTVSPENPVSCIFCPNEGGAFKQTTTGHWSHLLCAIWIPELTVGNAIYMEPVQDVEQLPKSRWKLVCSLCRERVGACIQCDNKTCFTAFHVTCARQSGLLMTMKTLGTEGILRAFCDKHLPPEMRDALESDDDESEFEDAPKFDRPQKARRGSTRRKTAVTTKTARAHAKSYRPGPPIVPHLIVNKLLDYVQRLTLSKRQPFVERLCRYWSLKREARRGAPLLKRLHLEPWTASSAAKHQTEAEKAVKLKFLTMLRNDLDKVRMLAELTRKREREKLRQAQVIKDVVDSFLFPHDGRLRLSLEKISAMDRQQLFLNFVNRADVPDYYQVIKEPMCWTAIDNKLEHNEYRHVEEFKHDINLVLDNAMAYNAPDTTFHRIAKRIKSQSKEILDQLDTLVTKSDGGDNDVGDLEPASYLLEALTSQMSEEVERDRLADLFAFELEKPKDPTPPPPAPRPKKSHKKDTAAERRKKWEEREARNQERLASGRATRAGQARADAFKHEAGLPVSSDVEPDTPAELVTTGRRTRKSLANAAAQGEGVSETERDTLQVPKREDRTSVSSGLSRSRSQVGVIRTEPVERLTDKERRERERELELVMKEVGDKDSFARFNRGWVLPEGVKRNRGGDKTEAVPAIPPKSAPKRVKARTSEILVEPLADISETAQSEAGPSRRAANRVPSISPISPAVSTRDSTLTPESDMPTPASRRKGKGRAALPPPSPLKQAVTPVSHPTRPSRSGAKRKLTEETREQTPRKSARKSRGGLPEALASDDAEAVGAEEIAVERMMAATGDEVMTPPPEGDEVTAHHDGLRGHAVAGVGTEISDPTLDAAEEDVEEEGGEIEVLKADAEEDDPFPPRCLVWAKLPGYPYFPGEVVDSEEDADDIPPSVFAAEAEARRAAEARGEELYLVNFYDKSSSYGWISPSKLALLGSDDEIDQQYLALKDGGKSKSVKTKLKKDVREAYREALARRGGAEEDEE